MAEGIWRRRGGYRAKAWRGIWWRRGGVYIHIICALRLAVQEAGGCLTAKKAYTYYLAITSRREGAGGCLTAKKGLVGKGCLIVRRGCFC
jgi:hypothetical protein